MKIRPKRIHWSIHPDGLPILMVKPPEATCKLQYVICICICVYYTSIFIYIYKPVYVSVCPIKLWYVPNISGKCVTPHNQPIKQQGFWSIHPGNVVLSGTLRGAYIAFVRMRGKPLLTPIYCVAESPN